MCVYTSRFANDCSTIKHMRNAHQLEIVNRGSDTQIKVCVGGGGGCESHNLTCEVLNIFGSALNFICIFH